MNTSNLRFIIISSVIGITLGLAYFSLTSENSVFSMFRSVISEREYSGDEPSPLLPNSFHNALTKASPAVVSVYTEQIRQWQSLDGSPLFNSLFADKSHVPVNKVNTNQGSGVIINKQGYIVTNEHLVSAADKITVVLSDGRQFAADNIGSDKTTDLAVLKIKSENALPELNLSMAKSPRVGDVVLAIGSPYGFGQTVTMGIVSATGRRNVTDTLLQDFIQIDAAINPGNSGGALINPRGELVGINTAIYAPENGAQGIGFAVPLRLVNHVVPQLIEHQRVERGWLGMQVDDLIYYPALKTHHSSGVVITGIFENSPAAKTGLLPGDVITHFGTKPVINAHQLMLEATTSQPNSEITLRGKRQDKTFTVKTVLTSRP